LGLVFHQEQRFSMIAFNLRLNGALSIK